MNTAVLRRGGRVLLDRVELAGDALSRMRGLLGRDGLAPGQGMYLAPCGIVHTVGMRFALDLVFVDRGLRVVRVARDVPAGRIVSGGRRAHGVFEIQSGWLPADAVSEGDALELA